MKEHRRKSLLRIISTRKMDGIITVHTVLTQARETWKGRGENEERRLYSGIVPKELKRKIW